MSKIAFIYPGQGAQTVGMGKDFYEHSDLAREAYEESAACLSMDIGAICFEENDKLDRTDYTQAALVTTCLAMTREILHQGIRPDMTAGLSLGEYCALVTAGGMRFEDAVKTIWVRGSLMHNAMPDGSGGMAAVLGLSAEKVLSVTESVDDVWVANYNCPGQIVITGKKAAIDAASPLLKEAGARRILPVNVSGPFHSPFLKETGDKLYETLGQVEWQELSIPYVTNVTAEIVTDIKKTKDLLRRQVSSSVMWEQSVRTMIDAGVDTFVEIGPGKTLSGFMRKINRDVTMLKIGTMEEMHTVVNKIKELN